MHFLNVHTFLQSRIVDKQPKQTLEEPRAIVCVVIPFKDQESANYVKKELKNLSIKVQTTVQPVFVSRKHYHKQHGKVPKDLLTRFSILKKCRNKFDCLVNKMLFIRDLKPTLNVQSDSIRAKVFV